MRRSRCGGFTLVEMLVVIMIIGILASILIPTINHILWRVKVTKCSHQLQELWKMQQIYVSEHSRSLLYPQETGGRFWMKLNQTTPPLISGKTMELFDCPVSGRMPPAGSCEYRGPATDVNLYETEQIVGADLQGSHGSGRGGIILMKMGNVEEVPENDPYWMQAERETAP